MSIEGLNKYIDSLGNNDSLKKVLDSIREHQMLDTMDAFESDLKESARNDLMEYVNSFTGDSLESFGRTILKREKEGSQTEEEYREVLVTQINAIDSQDELSKMRYEAEKNKMDDLLDKIKQQ